MGFFCFFTISFFHAFGNREEYLIFCSNTKISWSSDFFFLYVPYCYMLENSSLEKEVDPTENISIAFQCPSFIPIFSVIKHIFIIVLYTCVYSVYK